MTETTTPSPGYRDVSMPLTEIATNGLWLSLLLVAVPLVPYWLVVYGFGPFWGAVSRAGWLWILVWVLLLILAHEGVHAIMKVSTRLAGSTPGDCSGRS